MKLKIIWRTCVAYTTFNVILYLFVSVFCVSAIVSSDQRLLFEIFIRCWEFKRARALIGNLRILIILMRRVSGIARSHNGFIFAHGTWTPRLQFARVRAVRARSAEYLSSLAWHLPVMYACLQAIR